MVYVNPISSCDKINNLHISVLKKHGFLNKYIMDLHVLQLKVENACYEFNKVLLFTSHCNGSVFDNSMVTLTLCLDNYLTLLRKYFVVKSIGKFCGVRDLFKNLGLEYKEEYDYE